MVVRGQDLSSNQGRDSCGKEVTLPLWAPRAELDTGAKVTGRQVSTHCVGEQTIKDIQELRVHLWMNG